MRKLVRACLVVLLFAAAAISATDQPRAFGGSADIAIQSVFAGGSCWVMLFSPVNFALSGFACVPVAAPAGPQMCDQFLAGVDTVPTNFECIICPASPACTFPPGNPVGLCGCGAVTAAQTFG